MEEVGELGVDAANASDVDDGDHVVLESAVLERLLQEVRNAEPAEPHAYNRMHNRHNR